MSVLVSRVEEMVSRSEGAAPFSALSCPGMAGGLRMAFPFDGDVTRAPVSLVLWCGADFKICLRADWGNGFDCVNRAVYRAPIPRTAYLSPQVCRKV